MKIRSSFEAHEKLDNEISWRKKEIINLRNRLSLSTNYDAETFAKCLVLISYSHWEGFVKNASVIYLTYIKTVASNPSQLSNLLRASLLAWNYSVEYKSIIDKIELLERKQVGVAKFNFYINEMCSTESNLSYDVLQKIIYSIGLRTSSFDIKKNYIDEKILGHRNAIAHGEQREKLSKEESLDIADTVINLMNSYLIEISNAIDMKMWQCSMP